MYPVGNVGSALENLNAAAEGEHEEFVELYPTFAEVAEKEGFKRIANQFKLIAKVEKEHEERFLALTKNVDENEVFAGHIHIGEKHLECVLLV